MKRVAPIALLVLAAGCAGRTGSADDRPNIILIMTDDQGHGDLGVTGNPVLDTPHIDALASRSARMTTFYVSPVCAPTRACLMTGRYNYRTRAIDTWIGRAMMEPAERTVAEALRDAGYATGIFGKWHLGDCYPMRPQDQGFEKSLIHLGGGLAQPSEPPENNRRYTDPILFLDGKKKYFKGYCTDVYFDAAKEFISAARKPFFAYIAMNAPHGPYHDVPEDLYQKYKAKNLAPILLGQNNIADRVARIFAMIENVDQNVGRLQSHLDTLGITRNTIVIFMVDNGPNTTRYVGNMRGRKGGVHEGGIRSPFFVQWPARLKAGTRSDRVAAHIDVMPTLLDAAGAPVPDDLDGRSLLPLLEEKDVEWPDRTIFIQAHRGDAPIRYHHFAARAARWKLLRNTGFSRETPPPNLGFELYDVLADPREEKNLAAEKPEIVKRMKAEYDAWFDDVSTTRPNNYSPPRIVVGTDMEKITHLTKQDWRDTRGRGWGEHGRWLLRVEGSWSYTVSIRLNEPGSGTAELTFGSVQVRQQVNEAAETVVFKNVESRPGDADLTFTITRDGTSRGPYQVTVTRR